MLAPITISRSSLPTTTSNNDVLTLPNDLRQQLTTALFNSPSSIPAIQTALVSAFESSGFADELEKYVLEVLRRDPNSVPSEGQVLEMVIERLRESLAQEVAGDRKGKGRANGRSALEGKTLWVPKEVLDQGTQAVEKEMKETLKVLVEDDEEDWT